MWEFLRGTLRCGALWKTCRRASYGAALAVVFATGTAFAAEKSIERGIASIFYSQPTACGVTMSNSKMHAAHKTAPCGSVLTVRSTKTGRSIQVRVVDRGPYVRGRVIDLTPAAFKELGISLSAGLTPVEVSR